MLTENQTPQDPTQLKINWVEKKNSLQAIHIAINDIDSRLKGWGLAIWTAIGLGPNDVKDEEELYILPNSKLSKNDLQHKRVLLEYKKHQIEGELKTIQATAKQLHQNALSENDRKQDQYIKQEQNEALELYGKNKTMFFAEVLFDPQTEWAQQKEQIFHHANKIIAVCPLFSNETDRNHLIQAWKIVARARDIELLEHRELKRYTEGAEKFMCQLVSMLPIEMQGLKILYDLECYDRVDYYLSEVYVKNIVDEDDAYVGLISELINEIRIASEKKSIIVLSTNPLFNKLPEPVKEQLIVQHVYISQARFYLSLVDNTMWRNYVKILDDNINSVMHKAIAPNDCQNEFMAIKAKVAQNVQEKIRQAKAEMEDDFLRLNSELLARKEGN